MQDSPLNKTDFSSLYTTFSTQSLRFLLAPVAGGGAAVIFLEGGNLSKDLL
jgi:hypothetical protein